MIQVSFMGAMASVGCSSVLVDTGIEKIVLDYGTKIQEIPPLFPIPVEGKIDAVLLSHAHLDHSGAVPVLEARNSGARVFTPNVTKQLSELLWLDSIKISHEEKVELPFNKKDVTETLKKFVPTNFRHLFKLKKSKVTLFDAGHIPGCLTPDTIIQLSNGEIESIANLPENPNISCLSKEQKLVESSAKVWSKARPNSLYEINTRTSKLVVTPEHRLFKFTGKYEETSAENLRKGDYILAARRIPFIGKIQPLPNFTQSNKTNASIIKVPQLASNQVCQCIGYFVGDGNISRNDELYLHEEHKEVADFYSDMYRKTFSVKSKVEKIKNSNLHRVSIYSINLCKLFSLMGLVVNSQNKEVPKIIQKSPNEQSGAFLRGLFDSDGYVQEDCVGITSSSKKLIMQIKLLLLRFGILSHYREKFNLSKGGYSEGPFHVLEVFDVSSIRNFANFIGFSHEYRKKSLDKLLGLIGKSRRKSKIDVFPHINLILREVCETYKRRGTILNLRISREEFPVSIKHFFAGHPPSRESLRLIVNILAERLSFIQNLRIESLKDWHDVKVTREALRISQKELGKFIGLSQSYIYQLEKNNSITLIGKATEALLEAKSKILENTEQTVLFLKGLVQSDVFFDRIKEIKQVNVNFDKVYDLEVNPHHNFIANGIISHNSSMPFIDTGEKTILYTGDYKIAPTRLMKGADTNLPDVDVLITESTYCDREHPDRKSQEKELVKIVRSTLANDGIALISGFAVGRIDELLLVLDAYGIDYPVYVDGMAKKALTIINQNHHLLKEPKSLNRVLEKVEYVKDQGMRKRIIKNPGVILTTSGMLSGGPIMGYISKLHDKQNCSLTLTGFQVEGTPGKTLLETGRYINEGIDVEVKMPVRKLDFSSHLGRTDLFQFINKLNPEKIFCVHGEHAEEFARELKEKGYTAIAPLANDRIFNI